MRKDPYSILGVSRDASETDIKSAYRKMAIKYHPDRNKEPGAEEKFKEVTQAYESITHKKASTQPDLSDIFGGFGGFGDIFNTFFHWNAHSRRAKHGSNCYVQIEIGLKDVLQGTSKTISYKVYEQCNKCHGAGFKENAVKNHCVHCNGSGAVHKSYRNGHAVFRETTVCATCKGLGYIVKDEHVCSHCSGKGLLSSDRTININIPAGVDDNVEIVLDNMGNASKDGGKNGDLIVHVHVKPDKHFQRKGNDIFCKLYVSYPEACLGCHKELNFIDHSKLYVDIPPLSPPGHIVQLKGMGIPNMHDGHRGNLFVEICIKMPAHIDEEYKEILLHMKEKETV